MSELDLAIAAVYAGPLESFVARRDALAKELRAAGSRDEAATVKTLRKPSRLAWALNAAVQTDSRAADDLVARVTAVVEAQSRGTQVRGSVDALRSAVRGFADQAAGATARQGHDADHADLVQAVLAVIGQTDAFNALRACRLVDIPEPGGLDFLTWLPAPAAEPGASRDEPAGAPPASRAALEAAESALTTARHQTAAADRAFHTAEVEVEHAEERLRQAEQQVRERRAARDRARHESLEAARALLEAERAAADARARHNVSGS